MDPGGYRRPRCLGPLLLSRPSRLLLVQAAAPRMPPWCAAEVDMTGRNPHFASDSAVVWLHHCVINITSFVMSG